MKTRTEERLVLLDEVNFKWLLAGLGFWIDMVRFHTDPTYANHVLDLAEASDSLALQNCAASLRCQSTMTGTQIHALKVAVGTEVTPRPPHRSVHAQLTHKMWSTTSYALCGPGKYVVPSESSEGKAAPDTT